MSRSVVFDVETPNRLSNRMSALGITVIENGEITDEFYPITYETTFEPFSDFNITSLVYIEMFFNGAS